MTPCQIFLLALTATASTLVQARTPLELDQGLVPRNSSGDWRRVGRTPDNEQLPLIVHLRHTPVQLQELENEFWQVSTPDDKKYGMHLTQGMCLMMWNHYLLFLLYRVHGLSFFFSIFIFISLTCYALVPLFFLYFNFFFHTDQVTAIVAHPEDQLQRVVRWLTEGGATELRVGAHRDSIQFNAKAKDVEILFDTKLFAFVHQTRDVTLHRATTQYSVPDELSASIVLCSGLLRLPDLERLGGNVAVAHTIDTHYNANTSWPSDCKGCNQKVTPGVLAARYNFPTPSASDPPSTLAISEFQGQVWDQADLDKFSTSCSSVNFNVTVNKENGTIAPGKVCKIPIIGTTACGEALLDIEYAKGIAGPSIELTDIYQSSYNLLSWATAVENIDDANLIATHSVSYGNDEAQQTGAAYMNSANAAFMKIGVRGVSILFASGDQGVCGRSGCGFGKNVRFHPDFPAGSPYITSVGGTDFATRSTIGDEKAWNSGGGGFSDTFAIPSFQSAAVAQYKASKDANLPPQSMWNNTGRGYPDVAALAGSENPYCIAAGSLMNGIYGTSAACPVTAAIFARLNAVRVKNGGKNLGFLNPWIYKNAAAFNDVTQGTNNDNLKNGFTAVAGWDAATGVGTPNYAEMLKVL